MTRVIHNKEDGLFLLFHFGAFRDWGGVDGPEIQDTHPN
jgi:hypothetical protein